MVARKKHLINVHTSTGTTAPTGASLYLGEIAVQHTADDPALWIKVGSNESSTDYEKFIGESEIIELIDNSDIILGSGYTYSGLPYVNSATTVANAYSALTKEMFDNEKVVATALNDLNGRVIELSGNTGGGSGADVAPLSAAVLSLSAAVVTISGNSGGGGSSDPNAITGITMNGNAVSISNKVADLGTVVTEETQLSKGTTTGTGNVVTDLSVNNHQITLAKSFSAAPADLFVTLSGATDSKITSLSAATTAHIGNGGIHVTSAEKSTWDGKQDAIGDLATIRANAASGMAAYDNVTALSAGTISELAKKSNTGHTHAISEVSGLQTALDGKSDTGHTHSDYATTGTVNTLRNTVTSHTTNTEIHVTTAQTAAWDGKQDAIADLDTIRSNAAAGAGKVSNVQADWNTTATTAESYIKNKPTIPVVPTSNTAFTNDAGYITGYTETDPTVPDWAKAASKPTYTASEVGALSTGATLDDVADGTTRKLSNYATTANLNSLSGGTTAHTSNSAIHVPTGGTDGQVLMVEDGVPKWVTPATITYSSSEPTGGNEGDIWIQTS